MFKAHQNILISQKSDKKKLKPNECKRFGKNRLPFPIPLKKLNSNEVVWPLKNLKGFIYFNSCINAEDKCIDVLDPSSTQALYHFGFFGKGSLSSNAPIYEIIKDTLISIPEALLSSKDKNTSSETVGYLHINSFTRAFGPLQAPHTLVNELYQNQSPIVPNNYDDECFQSVIHIDKYLTDPSMLNELNKSQPNTDQETLKLAFEEAFFLSYCLGILNIFDPVTNQNLNLDQIWNTFCQMYNQTNYTAFPVLYAAYHHFRSKGWIVKSGIKFGSNFLLYKEGPPFYHSLFSVTVVKYDQDDQVQPLLTWPYTLSLNRISQGVSKKVILCYVIVPNYLQAEHFKSPKVIQEFEIQTLLMERWNPSQNRKDDDE